MGRFPALIAMAKAIAGERLSLFEKIYVTGTLLLSARAEKEEYDARILAFLLIKAVKGKSFLIDLTIKYWEKKFKELFPKGFGELLGSYFHNMEHPSAKWLIGEFV
jgi:hypothetical protein